MSIESLKYLAARSPQVFQELMRKSWIKDGLEQCEGELILQITDARERGGVGTNPLILRIVELPFLESVEPSDCDGVQMLFGLNFERQGLLALILADPRLRTGTTDALSGVVPLLVLEYDHPEAASSIWALPWIADGISESEAPLIESMVSLAERDPSIAVAAAEYIIDRKSEMATNFLHSLIYITRNQSASDQLTAYTWFTDGLDDAEAAFIITLSDIVYNSPELYKDLLDYRHTQHEVISLPLAGDVNVWVIQSAPPSPDANSTKIIAETVRISEEFLGVPFPTSDIILLVVPDGRGVYSGHKVSHMLLTKFAGEVTNISHETAHYYFHYNFGQYWLREGAAQFIQAYVNEQTGREDITNRKSELLWCFDYYENIRHNDYIHENIYGWAPGGDGPSPCHYVMGELLLIDIFETIGGEAMSSALREIYVPYNDFFISEGMIQPPTDEEVFLAFQKYAPEDRKVKLIDVYQRLHGGAFAFPVTEFTDDHGDVVTEATAVSMGEVVAGNLDYMFDFDYFRFLGEEGQLYQMAVDHESLLRTSTTVFLADGQTQDWGNWKSRRRTPSGPEIIWVAPSSDEFYFAVQNFGGESGPYTLTISAVEDAADDHGDNIETATSVSLDMTVEGTIESDFDFDFYQFEAIEGRTYQVECGSGTLEWFHWRLYGSDGAEPTNWIGNNQWSDDSGLRRKHSFEWQAPSSGQYYVAIDGAFGNLGTYSLTITEID